MAPKPSPTKHAPPRRLVALPARDRPEPAGRLPMPLTSLVGRADEIAAVADMLRRPAIRLVTITGPGGVGKTRLAIAAAEALRPAFPDGIWFIPLASIREASLVLPTIAAPFGVTERGGRPLLDRLLDRLHARDVLLGLDNFEQVVAAAPLLRELLAACPRVKAVVTSREVLRVSGEHDFPLSPLAAPDPAQLGAEEQEPAASAAQLFVERVQALDPAFVPTPVDAAAIAAICHRLDGLPLAIELAAAWGNLLTPVDLLERLEQRLPLLTHGPADAPARLRTMRNAIAWSHDLLDGTEQHLLGRLSVFVGGFTLQAAAAVCPDFTQIELLARIGSLVDKSLLFRETSTDGSTAGEARFSMLETVREFALEQLAAFDQETPTRSLHADWCLAFAEVFWNAISRGPVDPETLGWASIEHDNIRGALAWLEQRGDDRFFQLTAFMWPLWLFAGHFSEGRAWLERALASETEASPIFRVRALYGLGLLLRPAGSDEPALACLEESVALARLAGDPEELGRALLLMANVVIGLGDFARAESLLAEALALFRHLAGCEAWIGNVHHHRGLAAYGAGHPEKAASLLEEALTLLRNENDPRGVASTLIALALIAGEGGDVARATALYRESLPLWEALGMDEGLGAWLAGVATLAVACDRLVQAARLFGAATGLAECTGVTFYMPERVAYDRAAMRVRDMAGVASVSAAWDEGRTLPRDQVVASARDLLDSLAARETVPPTRPDFGLTPREVEVLRLLATGSTDREIAAALFVSPRTIQTHVAHIHRKLDVNSRTEAAALAFRHDLV